MDAWDRHEKPQAKDISFACLFLFLLLLFSSIFRSPVDKVGSIRDGGWRYLPRENPRAGKHQKKEKNSSVDFSKETIFVFIFMLPDSGWLEYKERKNKKLVERICKIPALFLVLQPYQKSRVWSGVPSIFFYLKKSFGNFWVCRIFVVAEGFSRFLTDLRGNCIFVECLR